jgi:hypothetical protein
MIRYTSIFLLAALFGSSAEAVDFSVSNLNDSGTGSLRQAILDANATSGADTITFAVDGSIILSSTLPNLTDAAGLTIDGTGRSITVSGNNAVQVIIVEAGTQLNLRHLTVANGIVDGFIGDGGGIENFGTLAVTDCTFSGNWATSVGVGGGIHNAGILIVTGSIFSGNSAFFGGGIYNEGALTVTHSRFSGNSALDGGGITSGGEFTVTNSTFSGNTAESSGGGIAGSSGGIVSNSTFSGNNATRGGGIFTIGTVVNSTFSGNASGGGGAIFEVDTVINSTFYGNSARFGNDFGIGGGILDVTPPFNLANTILANNTGGDCFAGATISPSGVNLVQDGSCGANSDPGHFITGDPNLGPLADNGGPTQTHVLMPGSPALDAADNSICAAPPVNNLDQRGVARPQGAFCDIGAFELEQTLPPLIETIISFFDQEVANGGLLGIGPGNSAENRPTALRNQLLTAGAFIDQNNIPQACKQLKSSLKRINTDRTIKRSEFVTGAVTSNLVQMIQDLRQELGCATKVGAKGKGRANILLSSIK